MVSCAPDDDSSSQSPRIISAIRVDSNKRMLVCCNHITSNARVRATAESFGFGEYLGKFHENMFDRVLTSRSHVSRPEI